MKTYEQFRDEILRSERFKEMTYSELETSAAKEYAKQWVKKALEETHETYVTATVEEYEKEIDAQLWSKQLKKI